MSGLSDPRAIFGIHSVTPYSRIDWTPYGILKVLQGSTLSMSSTPVMLTGGSSKFPWGAEDGPIAAEMALKVSEYPDFMFTLFGGIAPTANAAETSGNVGTLTNRKGTSVLNATTGIASAASATATDLKFGKFLVVAATTTTVNVYLLSDVDPRGTSLPFQDDTLKITATALTITASSPVTVPGAGFSLTGGSGTIGMAAGDTATIEVRPINTKNSSAVLGSISHSYPEFGCLVLAQRRGNGMMFEVDAYRCKQGAGIPIDFTMNKFSEQQLKIDLLYDSAQDGVLKVRTIVAP